MSSTTARGSQPTSASERNTRRPSSRVLLLEEFTRLVSERGYDGTTISDVAAAVGVSKGTVVHHFHDKQQMLELSHIAYMQRRLREIHLLLETEQPVPEHLAGVIFLLLRAHRDDRAANTSFLREFTRFSTDGSADLRALREEYTAVVAGVVRRGVTTGKLRDLDIRLTTLQLFGMCNYAWTWYQPRGSKPIEDIAAIFAQNFLNGVVEGVVKFPSVKSMARSFRALHDLVAHPSVEE